MWMHSAMGAALIWAISGLPGLISDRRSRLGQRMTTGLALVGSALGLVGASAALIGRLQESFRLPGPLADLSLNWRLDPLAGFFLAPVFLLGALGSVYGLEYWSQQRHPRTGQRLRLLFGLLVAALALVVLAADAVTFLLAWEVMALAAFFLVGTEEHKPEVRDAAWLYLVATHVGTLALFASFALWRVASGSFAFSPLAAGQAGLALRSAIFVTALIGFGVKAGMMPLHFWLPSAHANAPSHVSAILSGVLIKIGIYGLLRTATLLPDPPATWGGVVLGLGTISAVLGVVLALGQHDLKRLLAYHSIENIGIILMGFGLALLGQARGRPEWVVLGLAGCLLHVWNHALFKSLLFLAAGSVIHATGTRQIDRMGGLAKRMPHTAFLFVIGAVAICGLPPLNGFLSELLIYLGLFGTLEASSGAAVAVPALAMVGALAVACFVKAYGAVFLGEPRSAELRSPHEAPWAMRLPMAVLAACCGTIGLLPVLAIKPLQAVLSQWPGADSKTLADLVPVAALTTCMLALGAGLVAIFLWSRRPSTRQRASVTWDCGYARPTARMQYTASSFARTLVEMFRGVLRPREHAPKIDEPFPGQTRFHSHVDDVVLDGLLLPAWRRFRAWLSGLRILQQGSTQAYVLYILIILMVLLLLTLPLRGLLWRLLGGGAP